MKMWQGANLNFLATAPNFLRLLVPAALAALCALALFSVEVEEQPYSLTGYEGLSPLMVALRIIAKAAEFVAMPYITILLIALGLVQDYNPLSQIGNMLPACTNAVMIIGLLLVLPCLWLLARRSNQSLFTIFLFLSGAALAFGILANYACNPAAPVFGRDFLLLLFNLLHLTIIYAIFLYCINFLVRTNLHKLPRKQSDAEAKSQGLWAATLFLGMHFLLTVCLLGFALQVSSGSDFPSSTFIIPNAIIQPGLAIFYATKQQKIEQRLHELGLDTGIKVLFRASSVAASLTILNMPIMYTVILERADVFGYFKSYEAYQYDFSVEVMNFIVYSWAMMSLFWVCFMLVLIFGRRAKPSYENA